MNMVKRNSNNINKTKIKRQLVTTIKERCRVCYTCVRECPAKAIKIVNGQAEVIAERCIACGNCVKVCTREAKVFLNTVDEALFLLKSEHKVAAIIAPSFPAEFNEIADYEKFVGMIRSLGFDYVNEVGFGADLVSKKYQDIIQKQTSQYYISADCPAIVSYVEKYYPQLIPSLAPIVSPMVAEARVLKKKYNENLKIVFIGPCIAKKNESDEIDVGITFKELRKLFEEKNINFNNVEPSDFDFPLSGKGAIFPVSRGLIQTMDIDDTIHEGHVIVAEGRNNFPEALREFDSGLINSHHLELLCCEGCIMGAGMTLSGHRFVKRTHISNYVRQRLDTMDNNVWMANMKEYSSIDLTQDFSPQDTRLKIPDNKEIWKVLNTMGKFEPQDMLNCGACGYDTCEDHAIAVVRENEMCLPYTIEKLHKSIEDLEVSNDKLDTAKQALRQSEKLAHMGQLSAGIAHELNNPLGVVIMYTNILLDECKDNPEMKEDLELIVHQSERCKKIVSGLLNFARKNQVRFEDVDIEKLAKLSLNSIIVPRNIKTTFISNLSDSMASVDNEQIMQVLTNLNKNAIEAMPNGGELNITLNKNNNDVIFIIEDTGIGIPKESMDKLFTPFYTTKGIGKGTGLGLATTYGIVKMHKGKIEVESNNNPDKGKIGTRFIITIPKHQ